VIFSGGSWGRAVSNNGLRPANSDCSATRAARFADRVAENVAIASTSVPPAVASEATVDQSAIRSNLVDERIGEHRRACDGFASVADAVPPNRWNAPTPCAEWDARALVEHVIGFHEVLILRPAGVRVHRPRYDAAARWRVTADAVLDTLEHGEFDANLLAALTTDVLVHTWDLARATGVDARLDAALCTRALRNAHAQPLPRGSGMFAAEITEPPDADDAGQLVALYGRDPSWTPPPSA